MLINTLISLVNEAVYERIRGVDAVSMRSERKAPDWELGALELSESVV